MSAPEKLRFQFTATFTIDLEVNGYATVGEAERSLRQEIRTTTLVDLLDAYQRDYDYKLDPQSLTFVPTDHLPECEQESVAPDNVKKRRGAIVDNRESTIMVLFTGYETYYRGRFLGNFNDLSTAQAALGKRLVDEDLALARADQAVPS